MKNPIITLAALNLIVSTGVTNALELPSTPDSLSLRGFGTLGVVHNSTDKATFVRDKTQPKGPRGGGFMWETDSRLGLQMNWKPRENIEVMVQGLASYRYDGSYRPQLTWAFLKYAITPEVEVRVGKLGFDIYLNADSRNVGYSYLWVRPPVDYYGLVNYDAMNGADLNISHAVGDGILSAKLLAGRLDDHIALGEGLDYRIKGRIYGAHLKYQTLSWLLSLGVGTVDPTSENPELTSLLNALRATGVPQAISTADGLKLSAHNVYYYTFSAVYQEGPLQSNFGVYQIEPESLSYGTINAGFLSLGYRIGKWTPYVSYARAKSGQSDVDTGLPNTPYLAPINAGVQLATTMNRVDQDTISLGARYDFAKNLALKMQVDQTHSRVNPSMLWMGTDPDWNGRATLFSLALDFVF